MRLKILGTSLIQVEELISPVVFRAASTATKQVAGRQAAVTNSYILYLIPIARNYIAIGADTCVMVYYYSCSCYCNL